jgi:hypothetical protein
VTTLVHLYLVWLFTNTAIQSFLPGLRALQYADELFLLVALGFLWSARKRHVLSTELRRTLVALLAIHIASLALNWSSVSNALLVLISYAKPIAWAGVLYVLMSESPKFVDSFRRAVTGWFILQLPFVLVQALSGQVAEGNYDYVVGTFGPNGGLELGYMVGIVVCWLIPAFSSHAQRLRAAAGVVVSLLVILASATKQLFLLFALVLPAYFAVNRLIRWKTIAVVAIIAFAVALGLPAASPVGYDDYLRGADVLVDFSETRKVEGLAVTALLFWEHPLSLVLGTGPGMFTSFVALNAGTEYARLVNYAYFLQKPGEVEEGLGGTFNQASSSFLSVIGETGLFGLAAFAALVSLPFRFLRRTQADSLASQRSFLLTAILGLGCLLQNLLEGGIAIHLFWAMQVMLVVEAERSRNDSAAV